MENKESRDSMDYHQLAKEIIAGRRLQRGEDASHFLTGDLTALCEGADEIRTALCGNHVDLCTIINGRSGKCSEDCKFCAQSGHHCTGIREYPFLSVEELVADCQRNADAGVHRYSIVTAGKSLSGKDFETALNAYQTMQSQCDIELCASHGLLTKEQFQRLWDSGVRMYHENIETSRRNFPNICTTHTYDDKVECIKIAQEIGFRICSGGIIGMGETWEDRIDMAISLAELGVDSIPINVLMAIPGTPFSELPPLSEEEVLRTIAIFRYYNPTADVRLAGGRSLLSESGKTAFRCGANATITGNMLTTSGSNIESDFAMLHDMGFDTAKQ
jgi:biotin synthase